jgi:hypothetical protein
VISLVLYVLGKHDDSIIIKEWSGCTVGLSLSLAMVTELRAEERHVDLLMHVALQSLPLFGPLARYCT